MINIKNIISKKAQIQSQIFIYVFALIVVSLILVFGIKAIYSFKKDTEKVSIVNFQTDIKTLVASAAAEYGSVQKAEILLPKEFRQVCFTDSETANIDISTYPLIYNAVVDKTADNVYLVKEANNVEQFKTQTSILVNYPNHFMCINNTKGKIVFTIKGMSRYAEVSP